LLDSAVLFAPVGTLVPPLLKKLRPGGTLAINAIHLSPIPELDYSLIYHERTIRSVANATRRDGEEFLELAAEIPVMAHVGLRPQNIHQLGGYKIFRDESAVLNDAQMAQDAGAFIVEINPDPTPLSPYVDERLAGPAGEVLPLIAAAAGAPL